MAVLMVLLGLPPNLTQSTELPPTFSRTLYLVRHGAYVPDSKADPEFGPGLTPLGIAQSRLIAARLGALPIHFASMAFSPMTRTQQTAAVIHETLLGAPLTSAFSSRSL